MLCTVTITIINAYVFHVLHFKTLPSDKIFIRLYLSMVGICVILQGIAIAFDIASMFCDKDQDSTFSTEDFDNGTYTQKIVVKSTYLYPLVFLLFVNVIFCFYCVFQYIYQVNESNKLMLPLLKRLLTFTLIVLACGLPKLISMYIIPHVDMFVNISDCILHLSGVLLSLSYFYYAIVQDKRRWETRSLLRATLVESSLGAVDLAHSNIEDSSRSSIMMSSVASQQ